MKHMTSEQKESLLKICVAAFLGAAAYLLPFGERIGFVLYLAAYIVIGYEVLISAAKNIIKGEVFDENFLMAIASLGAFFIGDYPEAVAVMLFYQVGEFFQDLAVDKSRRSISALMDIRPDHANVLRDGEEISVSPEDVKKGEIIIVKPGEKIPLDGVITEGATAINTAALTGESLPRDCGVGENVISGAVNMQAVIKVRVNGVYAESTVAKILDLVENSAAKKAKSENFITRFAKIYTPCVVITAAVLAIIPPLLFGQAWSEWINRALIFLVVSCPCALVISVPLSFFGGIGGASKQGILVKGSNYLETLSQVRTIVFDKTGTLTRGSFTVSAIHPKDMPEKELLDIAALAESYSGHPIAESIVRTHAGHIDRSRITKIEELSGLGVEALIDGKTVYAGNGKLMDKAGVEWHECKSAGTIVHIALENEYCGHIVISDEVKPDSAQAISELRKLGVKKIVMLTGDLKSVGEDVGKELGVDETHSELLPADKVDIVEKLLERKQAGTALAFVGDGINDAPVLSRADLGIAMGALGSDAAIEAADIVLMDDKPSRIASAIRIAAKTLRIVKQNIIFALAVKAIVLLLGALGIATMWFAVFADVGVSILAILNAMRAMKAE